MAGELVERLNWWAAKRKPPKGMATLPADCREAADRIESLERENATLRAERDEARKALEPFAQAAWVVRYTERLQAREFGDDQPFQSGLAWQKDGVTRTITYGDLRRATAIRNMGGEG